MCATALAVVATPAGAAPPIELPALTRIASKLTGLKAKQKIRVVVLGGAAIEREALRVLDRNYPRDQQAYDETVYRALGLLHEDESLRPTLLQLHVRGVRGLYDPVRRTLYARRGANLRTTLLHELVHALQDQAFDLRRLSELRRGKRDAGLAAYAAVEGAASLATESLMSRSLASHSGSRIRLFLGLEHEFPYATGLRFAATLRNLGGNAAVNGALRRFPATTEQVFHLDAYLSREAAVDTRVPDRAGAYVLDRTDTFGELDVRALLAIFQVPRLDHVGDGWGGGRTAVYRDPNGTAVVVALDWDGEDHALEWREAVDTFVNEAFDPDVPGRPAQSVCAADACWLLGGHAIAFERTGVRTALAFARTIAGAASLARETGHT